MDIYENRNEYRTHTAGSGLCLFRVTIKETDLFIASSSLQKKALTESAEKAIEEVRSIVESEILRHPDFLHSLHPLDLSPEDPPIIRLMKQAGIDAHVGPMASVAGTISEYVGHVLETSSETVIVENGGDIYLRSPEPLNVEIHAPGSPLSDRLAMRIPCTDGMGICTSAGTYGHSLSFGRSQAAVVISQNTALADAAATRLGNLLKDSDKIPSALEKIMEVPGVLGALGIVGDQIGFIGEVELVAV